MDNLILDANDKLLDAIGYINTLNLVLQALEQQTHGRLIDDALHSLRLATDHASELVRAAQNNISEMETHNA